MVAFSRRAGLGTSPEELEQWLQSVEEELFIRQLADIDSSETANVRGGTSSLPQITGLSIDPNTKVTGGLGIKWNTVNHPDLLNYEVQLAKEDSFNPIFKTVKNVQSSSLVFDLDIDENYFVRVRAVGRNDQIGEWSGSLATSVGSVASNNLAIGATKGFASETLIFNGPGLVLESPIASSDFIKLTVGSAYIETIGAIVIPRTNLVLTLDTNFGGGGDITDPNRYSIELLRDGVAIDRTDSDLKSTYTSFVVSYLGGLVVNTYFTFDTPPPGKHVYSLRYTLDSSPPFLMRMELHKQTIQLVELKR